MLSPTSNHNKGTLCWANNCHHAANPASARWHLNLTNLKPGKLALAPLVIPHSLFASLSPVGPRLCDKRHSINLRHPASPPLHP
jgi:hypothetical protein